MTTLTADRAQIEQFVHALFKHAPAGTFVPLIALHDKGEARDGPAYFPWEWIAVDDVDRLVTRATACAQWCANQPRRIVFCPPIATFLTPTRATGDNLAAGLAVSVEIDGNGPAGVAVLAQHLGPPTVVVNSGGIYVDPQTGEVSDKQHAHWRLNKPALTKQEQETLLLTRQLAAKLIGSDTTSNNSVHPSRWPGSWHKKAAPRPSRIVG
jgi:hypothetical protein